MRTLILLVLFCSLCYCINAQNTYPIIREALRSVNQYNYNSRTNIDELENISALNIFLKKKEVKLISNKLNALGFKFDSSNDTILIITSYESHIIGRLPYLIFAQSSQSMKILKCDSYRDLNYTELLPAEKFTESYYQLLYLGYINKFRDLFLSKGESVGKNIALRVIIKNGKIVMPSLLWFYADIPNIRL